MRVLDLEQWHIDALLHNQGQDWLLDYIDETNYASYLNEIGPAFSLVTRNNIVLGAAGVWLQENHRGLAWALISDTIGVDFIHFHKAVKTFLDNTNIPRIEMAVNTQFKEGERWAKMLGFKHEGLMHKYYSHGDDAFLFARIR